VRQSPSRANDHPRVGERSHSSVGAGARLGTNVRPCAPGEGANDRSMVGEHSLPQCV
jgi:hypothetical protein